MRITTLVLATLAIASPVAHAQWLETTIGVGGYPWHIVWNSRDSKVYCANRDGNAVTVIDGATNAVLKTVPVGDQPRGLA